MGVFSRGVAKALALVALLTMPQPGCADLRNEAPDPDTAEPIRSNVRLDWVHPNPAQKNPIDAPVLLCFSGRLSPASISPGVVSLSSGSRNYDSRLEFDLVDWKEPQSARPRCSGSLLRVFPPEPLSPNTRYRLRIVDRLRDWEGLTLPSEGDPRWVTRDDTRLLMVEFFTGEHPLSPTPEPPPTTFRSLFEPKAVFGPNSPSCGCHLQAGSFDLRDPQALYEQLRYGTHASGQPWIAPGFPSSSYLIFKLLRTDDGHALAGIAGDPMPPQLPLAPKHFAQIASWIEDGALP